MVHKKNILLIILDGFGVSDSLSYNATLTAKMPNFKYYKENYAYTTIEASSEFVGLPNGQFGNSEVGHLNIGSGRIIQQDITRIDNAIKTGNFFIQYELKESLKNTKNKVAHIMGLCSNGGVHSHIEHIIALINFYNNTDIENVWLHLFLDGRDCPPQSATLFVNQIEEYIQNYPKIKIASICGRYYVMDRDKRYDRLKIAYNAIFNGETHQFANNPILAIKQEYQNNRFDEFVLPYIFNDYHGINNGDIIVVANFRADRVIQLVDAMTNNNFNEFTTKDLSKCQIITMTQYDKNLPVRIIFKPQTIVNSFGEYIANLGLKQLRIAETEKYPHITYFFNGGRKDNFINEDRILIPSPRDVATYDKKPEMSLPLVTDELIQAINSNKYNVIITNFANPDMVGHTGNFPATIKALEVIDEAIGKVVTAMLENNGEILITADHGNCEIMFDKINHQPHTQHTTNMVPLLYIGRTAKLKNGGSLQDIAPTLLAMIEIVKPQEMTGNNLIIWQN